MIYRSANIPLDGGPAPIRAEGPPPELVREPLVANERSYAWITDKIAGIAEGKSPVWWKVAFTISLALALVCCSLIVYLTSTGIGVWGVNHPVMWGFAIINFVWWIGIGHAGTLISAILFLLRQRWRTSINRAAEAMTIFAVICAAIYPVIHLGRIWYSWWLFPIPTSNAVWPQFRSPLIWDVFAVLTYFTVSVLFWYMGLIPDLAAMRDRAETKIRKIFYGVFALGWTGSNRHWSNYEKAYLVLAGLSTALVVSVHSIVSLDFAVSQLPGWHTTIFPPYFVAGAIFSGMGMVLTLIIPLRAVFKLEDLITKRHIDLMCKVTLGMCLIVAYSYATEFITAQFSGNPDERFTYTNRATGPYAWAFWTMIVCNVVVPQLLWVKTMRFNLVFVFLLSIVINIGMWFERFVIVITSLHRDFLPSNWDYYSPTWVDILTFVGTFGIFSTLFLLFLRWFPLIAIAEVKGVTSHADPHELLHERKSEPAPAGLRCSAADSQSTSDSNRQTPQPTAALPHGILAEFESPAALLQAAEKVREQGFQQWDVFSPFPVHGMDRAMGLIHSNIGWFAFVGGLIGFASGMLMIWWMNAIDYPLIVGGKPLFSPHTAFLPAYELTILLGAFGTFVGLFLSTGLPRLHHPLLRTKRFSLATRDRFFLVIETSDPKYSEAKTRQLLESLGSRHIEVIQED